MDTVTLQQAKKYRRISRIFFCIINYLTPLIIIGAKYKLIYRPSGLKITLLGAMLTLLMLYRTKNKLLEWINSWEYSTWKHILLGLNKIAIFLIIWVIAMLAERGIGKLSFCFGWIAVCSSVSYLIINPYIEKYDHIVKKEIRKEEMKEALREYNK